METFNKLEIFEPKTGKRYFVWQKVDESELMGYVDAKGAAVKLPRIHEATVVETDLETIE